MIGINYQITSILCALFLPFFAGSDGIVLENLGVRFMQEVKKYQEVTCFYGFQILRKTYDQKCIQHY